MNRRRNPAECVHLLFAAACVGTKTGWFRLRPRTVPPGFAASETEKGAQCQRRHPASIQLYSRRPGLVGEAMAVITVPSFYVHGLLSRSLPESALYTWNHSTLIDREVYFTCHNNDLCAVPYLHFPYNAMHMRLYGAKRNIKLIGNYFVGAAPT